MNPLDPLKNWTPPYVSEYSFASIIDDFDSIGDRAVSARISESVWGQPQTGRHPTQFDTV